MRNVSICVAGGKAPSIFTALSQGRGSAGPSEGLRLVRMGAKLWLAGTRGWSVGRGSAAWLGGCGQHGASPPGIKGGDGGSEPVGSCPAPGWLCAHQRGGMQLPVPRTACTEAAGWLAKGTCPFSREKWRGFSVLLSVQDIRQLAKGSNFSWTEVATN